MEYNPDDLVVPREVLDEEELRRYEALRQLAKAKLGSRLLRRDEQLPRLAFMPVKRHILDQAVYEWQAATDKERQIALDKQARTEWEAAEFEKQWAEERRLKDLADSEEYLPIDEVCGKVGVKPGTLRQWVHRGHVSAEDRQIRTVRGWRVVRCYSVGDAVRKKRAAGVTLADRRAVNQQDALRMLREAVLECERMGVSTRVLQKHLLMLAKGDRGDSNYIS